jgi:hypothetical protein
MTAAVRVPTNVRSILRRAFAIRQSTSRFLRNLQRKFIAVGISAMISPAVTDAQRQFILP